MEVMNRSRRRGALWAVTTYFNPQRYRRRLINYRAFRRHLGVPLLTVELNRHAQFELTANDADVLLQLTGEDRIWQKERLLNIGFERLPAQVDYVAWIDCDLIFDGDEWIEGTVDAIEQTTGAVQLFGRVDHLPRDLDPTSATVAGCRAATPIFSRFGVAKTHRLGWHDYLEPGVDHWEQPGSGPENVRATRGFAWAARRDVIARCGLYDANVVGGGDSLIIMGAAGRGADLYASGGVTAAHAAGIDAWVEHASAAGLLPDLGFVDTRAFHLWHGEIANRRYRERHALLVEHGFDPETDLELADNGTWRWRDPASALADAVATYFESRREDG
ncbi:MAG: hypothetical protein AAGE01_00410 [Pseudomonadota bacterium]